MKRSGTADLPLHSGRVPQWLAERMTKLGTAIKPEVDFDALLRHENAISPSLNGRTVFDDRRERGRQRSLF